MKVNIIKSSFIPLSGFHNERTLLFFPVYFLLVVVLLTVFTGFLVVLPGQELKKFFEVLVIKWSFIQF